jgi:hypothetical protein
MQQDLKKRDALVQELYTQFRSPETNLAGELEAARKEIERLRGETSELRMEREGGTSPRRSIGRWQEFLETPISVSRARSRREERYNMDMQRLMVGKLRLLNRRRGHHPGRCRWFLRQRWLVRE